MDMLWLILVAFGYGGAFILLIAREERKFSERENR